MFYSKAIIDRCKRQVKLTRKRVRRVSQTQQGAKSMMYSRRSSLPIQCQYLFKRHPMTRATFPKPLYRLYRATASRRVNRHALPRPFLPPDRRRAPSQLMLDGPVTRAPRRRKTVMRSEPLCSRTEQTSGTGFETLARGAKTCEGLCRASDERTMV